MRFYVEAHRYDGAAVHHDRRLSVTQCALQPRDVAIVRDVCRYKFLTAHQLRELWWEGRSEWAAQRRLRRLFDAGLIERFRPLAKRGSFPWTYHLGEFGHRLLRDAGLLAPGARYRRRAIYDFGHVLHDLQLNAWVLACRRHMRDGLVSWDGETDIDPPPAGARGQLRLGDDWSVEELRDPRPRLLRPDAVLSISTQRDRDVRVVLVEFDRMRRFDKNYGKLRRYDAFLNWWWHDSVYGDHDRPPYVVFVCQDEPHRENFLAAADHELTGHCWHASAPPERHEYVGRQRILFAVEREAHGGILDALRLPPFPIGHPARTSQVTRAALAAVTSSGSAR
jgi:hypothetical protein